MNRFVVQICRDLPPGGLATVATPLLDAGAEFAMFGASNTSRRHALVSAIITQATFTDLIDGELKEVRYSPYIDPFL